MSGWFYVLDDHGLPVAEPDLEAWSLWMATHDPQVALDHLGDCGVSTVFLGVDHRHWGNGAPILWETMIFGGKLHETQERYTSRDAALAGHRRWVAFLRDQGESGTPAGKNREPSESEG